MGDWPVFGQSTAGDPNGDIALARFNAAGDFDASFGTNGKATCNVVGGVDVVVHSHGYKGHNQMRLAAKAAEDQPRDGRRIRYLNFGVHFILLSHSYSISP